MSKSIHQTIFFILFYFLQTIKAEEHLDVESLDNIQAFVEVFSHLKHRYVDPIPEKILVNKAIQGMLTDLDPHSAYLTPKEIEDLQETTSGEFGGIGIEITFKNGLVEITACIPESPAFQAGIKRGDIIKEINDQPLEELSLSESIGLLRGSVGSTVKLILQRIEPLYNGKEKTTKIIKRVERSIIKYGSLEDHLFEKGIGYIKISQFQDSTRKDLLVSLRELSSNGPLLGLILDLRDNPGGLLKSAVDVTDTFLDKGTIVSIEGREDDSTQIFSATSEATLYKSPMIVIINGGSASASEIVAGALQDQNRALILGTPSFGKGSVQTIMPLSNGHAVKLTTARYYTPNGNSIQAKGISPTLVIEDIEVTRSEKETLSIKNMNRIKESDLPNHLSSKQLSTNPGIFNPKAKLLKDRQLLHSYILLNGLAFLKNHQ